MKKQKNKIDAGDPINFVRVEFKCAVERLEAESVDLPSAPLNLKFPCFFSFSFLFYLLPASPIVDAQF